MNTTRSLIPAMLVVLSAVLVPLNTFAAERCETVSATLTAQLVLGPQGPYWTGQSYLQFGRSEEVVQAQYYSLPGPPPVANPAGVTRSEESFVTIVPGRGSFVVRGSYTGTPASTPYLMGLHETGSLDPLAGTGLFAGRTGMFNTQGSYVTVLPFPPVPERPWLFIGAMRGFICEP